jgi:hypothetical protein
MDKLKKQLRYAGYKGISPRGNNLQDYYDFIYELSQFESEDDRTCIYPLPDGAFRRLRQVLKGTDDEYKWSLIQALATFVVEKGASEAQGVILAPTPNIEGWSIIEDSSDKETYRAVIIDEPRYVDYSIVSHFGARKIIKLGPANQQLEFENEEALEYAHALMSISDLKANKVLQERLEMREKMESLKKWATLGIIVAGVFTALVFAAYLWPILGVTAAVAGGSFKFFTDKAKVPLNIR